MVMDNLINQALLNENYQAASKLLKRQCQQEIAAGQTKGRCANLVDLSYIDKQSKEDVFILAVEYFLSGQPQRLKTLSENAPNKQTRFLATGVLSPSLTHCSDETFLRLFGGWRCYQLAKETLNASLLSLLKRDYQSKQALHKVADVEFLLAQYYANAQQTDAAIAAASKAAVMLVQLGEIDKAEQVRRWREGVQ
jgi:hypothetical protein